MHAAHMTFDDPAWAERATQAEALLAEADALIGVMMASPAGKYLQEHNETPYSVSKGIHSAVETWRDVYHDWERHHPQLR